MASLQQDSEASTLAPVKPCLDLVPVEERHGKIVFGRPKFVESEVGLHLEKVQLFPCFLYVLEAPSF